MIAAHALTIRVGAKILLDQVSVVLMPGRLTILLGANGAGKSTLIAALAGERTLQAGRVEIDGETLAGMNPRHLARRRAVLPQSADANIGFTVEEIIALGRLPHAGTPAAHFDAAALDHAVALAGIEGFRGRRYATLSGGERQRVQFARAAAQLWRPRGEAPNRYLMLDEPTAALDLRHRTIVLEAARQLARSGLGVLAAVHDLDLAARFADDVILLRDGRLLAAGPIEAVLTQDHLETCFDMPVEFVRRADGSRAILA